MKRKQILVAGIVLAIFCLGVIAGRRSSRSASATSFSASRFSSSGKAAECVDFHGAGTHAGETGCVSGRVVRVFASRGGNTFLDFCEDYHDCPFTSVIFSSDKTKFGDIDPWQGGKLKFADVLPYIRVSPKLSSVNPNRSGWRSEGRHINALPRDSAGSKSGVGWRVAFLVFACSLSIVGGSLPRGLLTTGRPRPPRRLPFSLRLKLPI